MSEYEIGLDRLDDDLTQDDADSLLEEAKKDPGFERKLRRRLKPVPKDDTPRGKLAALLNANRPIPDRVLEAMRKGFPDGDTKILDERTNSTATCYLQKKDSPIEVFFYTTGDFNSSGSPALTDTIVADMPNYELKGKHPNKIAADMEKRAQVVVAMEALGYNTIIRDEDECYTISFEKRDVNPNMILNEAESINNLGITIDEEDID